MPHVSTRTRPLLVAAALCAGAASPVAAQVQPSEAASTAQVVDGTTITVEYSRPVARGRRPLFGNLVDWGGIWTPGANWATTLEVDRPVRVNGHAVDAGRYSVWMVPSANGPWTVILDRKWRRYHTDYPRNTDREALRFTVAPERGWPMEALAWYVPVFTRAGALLRMHWGPTWVDLDVTVTPTEAFAFGAGSAGRYAGTYRVPGENGAATVVVDRRDGWVRARVVDGAAAFPGLPAAFDLWPAVIHPGEDHAYNPAVVEGGVLERVHPEWTLVFEPEGDRAGALAIRRAGGGPAGSERD